MKVINCGVALIAFGSSAFAAEMLINDGRTHVVPYSGGYVDFIIPDTATDGHTLDLKVVGGDGGRVRNCEIGVVGDKNCQSAGGGVGATLMGEYPIEFTDSNYLNPGSQLRFIVGDHGESYNETNYVFSWSRGAGGGGGTGIAVKGGNLWEPLLIAGAGGGGYAGFSAPSNQNGKSGNPHSEGGTEAKSDLHSENGGSSGYGGMSSSMFTDIDGAKAGGGMKQNKEGGESCDNDAYSDSESGYCGWDTYLDGEASLEPPKGGTGAGKGRDGGFGFGGGGSSWSDFSGEFTAGGGGGGYSGGAAAMSAGGGGGGSFPCDTRKTVDDEQPGCNSATTTIIGAIAHRINKDMYGQTSTLDPQKGFISYQFTTRKYDKKYFLGLVSAYESVTGQPLAVRNDETVTSVDLSISAVTPDLLAMDISMPWLYKDCSLGESSPSVNIFKVAGIKYTDINNPATYVLDDESSVLFSVDGESHVRFASVVDGSFENGIFMLAVLDGASGEVYRIEAAEYATPNYATCGF